MEAPVEGLERPRAPGPADPTTPASAWPPRRAPHQALDPVGPVGTLVELGEVRGRRWEGLAVGQVLERELILPLPLVLSKGTGRASEVFTFPQLNSKACHK